MLIGGANQTKVYQTMKADMHVCMYVCIVYLFIYLFNLK